MSNTNNTTRTDSHGKPTNGEFVALTGLSTEFGQKVHGEIIGWAHAKKGGQFLTPETARILVVSRTGNIADAEDYIFAHDAIVGEETPTPAPDVTAVQAFESRVSEISAVVVSAIQAGNAIIKDTGTNSVSETTLYAGDKRIAVFPRYDARLGGVGFRRLDSPAVAQAFINAAAAQHAAFILA